MESQWKLSSKTIFETITDRKYLSVRTEKFRKLFSQLPQQIKTQAKEAYKLFQQNPAHPSLGFKEMNGARNIYEVRIGIHYRALGVMDKNKIKWFWIGSHADIDKMNMTNVGKNNRRL